jgi:hypothetical protein
MPLIPVTEKLPDVSVQQRSSDELTKLVRKLRWMGFEKEAERTQRMLSDVVPAGGILTQPHETD